MTTHEIKSTSGAPDSQLSDSPPNEKSGVVHDEALSSSESLGYDTKATNKLVRKMDVRLLPFLALLYLLSFLDRSNIGMSRFPADQTKKALDFHSLYGSKN